MMPASASQTNIDVEAIRYETRSQIDGQLMLSRLLLAPQIIIFVLLSLTFGAIGIYGVLRSLQNTGLQQITDLKALIPYLTTGSSGVLGAVVLPLLKRLNDISHQLIDAEKRAKRARLAISVAATTTQMMAAFKEI
jgi:hypothetical protein